MKGTKQYRFEENPKEKEFHDKFTESFDSDIVSLIVFGGKEKYSGIPKRDLTQEEQTICVNLIQWLGSPVGQGFLRDCGH